MQFGHIIPLVPSSFALRYISIMPSLYLRYASASLTEVDRVHYGGWSSSLRRRNEERTKGQRRRKCYINSKRCDDTRLRLTVLRMWTYRHKSQKQIFKIIIDVWNLCNTTPCPFTIVTLMSGTWYKELLRALKQPYHAMIWPYYALIWPYYALKRSYHAMIRVFFVANVDFSFGYSSFEMYILCS